MEQWNNTTSVTKPLTHLSNCTVDTSYRFVFYQVSYSVIFTLGLATNSLALRRLWLSPRTLTSTAVYMANLSAADLFFVISLPLRIYYHHLMSRAHWEPGNPSSCTPGGAFCQVTFTLKYISLYGGIVFLVCIAVDRYFAVVHPLASAPRRLRTALLVSSGLWCLVLGLSVGLPLLHSAASRERHSCLMDPSILRHHGLILTALGLVLGAFVLPTALLVFSYCSVLKALRRQPRRRRRLSRRHTLTVIYWVLAVFLLCFTPYHVNLLGYTLTHLGLLRSCSLAKVTKVLHPVVLTLASSNCCLNPLIYYFSSSLVHKEPAGSKAVEATQSFTVSRH